MDAAQVLREAVSHVEKGWVRGELYSSYGRVCALGAINRVIYGTAEGYNSTPEQLQLRRQVTRLLAQVMKEQYDVIRASASDSETVITYVNDDLVKSRKEIISCMEKAALSCEEGL